MISTLALSAIGVTISLIGLGVSILAFRYARAKHIAGEPYIVASRTNATLPPAVNWAIEGPGKDDWKVVEVRCSKPLQILASEWGDDGFSSILLPKQPPSGSQVMANPLNPIFVAPAGSNADLVFVLSARANPKLRLKRPVCVLGYPRPL